MNDLIEPVQDICCGKEARLVEFLRSRDIEAFGASSFFATDIAAAVNAIET